MMSKVLPITYPKDSKASQSFRLIINNKWEAFRIS
uniref:Uncharacterized protein n=1 Tax=Rhizophora mucronata TaxID=61149 RepID=A0A2P2QW71_RHIMU